MQDIPNITSARGNTKEVWGRARDAEMRMMLG
jgi:hypothetical protein